MDLEEVAILVRQAADRERQLWRKAMHDHIAAFRRGLEKYSPAEQEAMMSMVLDRLDTCKTVEARVDRMRDEISANAMNESDDPILVIEAATKVA